MLANDPLRNVLYVDLATGACQVRDRSDLFAERLGGAGVAVRLLHEECPAGCDPLAPENPVVLAVGPLTGLFPLASKTVAMFKSPLTGNLGESHAGGRSAVAIRMAGYGAVVLRGASAAPVYLSVDGGEVRLKDARTLWGIDDSATVGRIIRENERGAGLRTIMRIGTAGEKRVRYAGVTTESYRHFGRLGLGAVLGAKNLKAVAVGGRRELPVADIKAYRALYEEVHRAAVDSPAMKKYHDLGTPENVRPLNALGGLPVRNLQAGRIDPADRITGEAFAEAYLGRRLACSHCPVGCVHIAALREPHPVEPYFYKTSMIGYDYELIYAFGSMLGVTDPAGILRLIEEAERTGLDIMSAGVVLAWATDAFGAGLLTVQHTHGLKLGFGDWQTYLKALELIDRQPNQFYIDLGQGVAHASSVYGGVEFALHCGGNEMPGYHTGPAAHLGFLLGARHSHLDNAGYSIDQKALADGTTPDPAAVVDKLMAEEQWRQVLSSLAVCFFARGIYTKELAGSALAAAGFDLAPERIGQLGRDIYRDKFAFKFREGFKVADLALADRVHQTPAPGGPVDKEFIAKALRYFEQTIGGA